ncbi:MAG: PsiF family protein [Candidatus Binatia bacterium]
MSKMLIALSLIALLAGPAAAANEQQQRMKDCNATATQRQLTGDARKAFVSECLKGDRGGQLTAQQQKMNDSNATASAKGLKGDARQQFMSSCLSQ